MCVLCSVAQSCLTLCNLMNCSLPGSSIHGTLWARILEQANISSSRGSSLPKFLVTSPLLTCLHFLSLPSICAHFFHSTPFLLYKYCPFFCTQRPSTVSMRSHETNGIWFLFYLFFWKIFKLWTSVTCSKY